MLHSECQPLMLKGSEGPLPEAAAQLAIPLSSLLPLVPLHALSKQVCLTACQAYGKCFCEDRA